MGFAKKARPLYEKSKETPNWTWTEPMKQAFQTLRRALQEAPVLALPNPNKPFQLFVDEKQKNKKGGLDATMETMEMASDIPFKVIGPDGLWVAPLPPHHCSHCRPHPRCRQVDVWTATLGLHPPCHRRGFKTAAGEILAEALVARKPDIACHPGSSPV